MSNLGGYQAIVVLVKKLGGPGQAAAIVIGGAASAGALALAGAQKIAAKVRERREADDGSHLPHFTVTVNASTKDGLEMVVGNQFRVLERDGDAVLIEILGQGDNPHVASAEFLKSVSNFQD